VVQNEPYFQLNDSYFISTSRILLVSKVEIEVSYCALGLSLALDAIFNSYNRTHDCLNDKLRYLQGYNGG